MQRITSGENSLFKFGVRVRAGKEKDLIFAEGPRLAAEALRSGVDIHTAFFSGAFAEDTRHEKLIDVIAENSVRSAVLPARLFERLADTKNPQGITLICRRPLHSLGGILDRLNSENSLVPLILVLHRIANPGNLGAILRTAAAVDAAGVITTKDSADVYSPAALRSSAGAAFRLPSVEKADFEELLEVARKEGLTTSCAEAKGAVSYLDIDWRRRRLVVFGAEARGLAPQEAQLVEESFSIPMTENTESLNLAVSAGIILYEAARFANRSND